MEPRPFIKITRPTSKLPAARIQAAQTIALPQPTTPLARALPHLGVLAGLSAQSLSNLAGYGSFESYPTGTNVVLAGAKQERLIVVVEGRLSLAAHRGAQEVNVTEVHAGECLGEVSLLEPGPSSATIRVLEDAVLWTLDITGLRLFIGDHPGGAGAFLMGMASCLSGRLREANQRICQHSVMPLETLPAGRERAITATNAPIQPGFFDRIKKSMAGGDRKVQISTRIKL